MNYKHLKIFVAAYHILLLLAAAVLSIPGILPTDTPVEPTETHTETTEKVTEPVEISAEAPQIETKPLYLDVSLSIEKQAIVRQICKEYNVPFDLVIAMMSVESNFDETAISATNDYGIMQINIVNHKWLRETLGITDFLDFEQGTECGVYILSDLFEKYTDTTKVLMCYNLGESGAVSLWEQGIHTSEYATKVLKAREQLIWLT